MIVTRVPSTGRGLDVEFVRELARAVEAEPEAVAGRVAVAQRELDIGDAGALVLERQAQPDPLGALSRRSTRISPPPP